MAITNPTAGARWVRPLSNSVVVYAGPDASSARVGSVYPREQLTYLGEKTGTWASIEFNGTAGKVLRGYIDANSLTSNIDDVSQRAPGIAFCKNTTLPGHLPYGGGAVAQGFNDLTSNLKGHFGYDIGAPGRLIKPLFEGVFVSSVAKAGNANGRTVVLRHSIGGEAFFTTYSHMASVESFVAGQRVFPTTILGVMGGSGKTETAFAPHLHLCLYIGNPQKDPYGYCDGSHNKTFAQTVKAGGATHGYYYGADSGFYPHCGGVRFYDPYRVYTSGAALIRETRYKA